MSVLALEIPDKTPQIAEWLERHVTGLQLGALVAELQAIHRSDEGVRMSMEASLGPLLGEVLENGLSVLGSDRMNWFLQYPEWLLELQERVLLGGGSYWDHVSERTASESEPALDEHWEPLRELVQSTLPEGVVEDSWRPAEPSAAVQRRTVQVLSYVATILATLLVAVGIRSMFPAPEARPVASGWGWSRPDALAGVTDSEYLETLATAADEWFKKRPESRVDLAKRVGEFRNGCSRLLVEEHAVLAAEDRAWLHERCRAWADKLDAQRTALEEGADPIEVRDEVDTIIKNLVVALRTRAKAV